MKRTLALMLSFLLLISMVACSPAATEAQKRKPSGTPAIAPSTAYAVSLPMADGVTNFVQFTMEGGATFVIELYPEFAPKTVENFQHLVYAGFYNGLTFFFRHSAFIHNRQFPIDLRPVSYGCFPFFCGFKRCEI